MCIIVEVEEESAADRGEIKDRLTGKRGDNMRAWKRAVGDGQLLDTANFLIEIGKPGDRSSSARRHGATRRESAPTGTSGRSSWGSCPGGWGSTLPTD